MNCNKSKEQNSDNKSYALGLVEMLIEDLKTNESSSDLLMEALETITRRAKQARRILETQQTNKQTKKTPSPSFRNEYGGPWSNALRAMSLREQRMKRGIKLREEYDDTR